MFNYCTPEKMGVRSEDILACIQKFEQEEYATHDFLVMRKDHILFEHYWKPFHKDFLHRMYSVTKSFVSLAIGFLEQDGLLDLDDKLIDHFPEEAKAAKDPHWQELTLRQMLTMRTAKKRHNWFERKPADRVLDYFQNENPPRHPGTFFEYDSHGSFILGALVERISKKPLMDYLREKVLDQIGFSKEAYMLQCPGGHSWGDSALLCKPTDLLKVAQFCLHKGNWNGKQLLNSAYLEAATACQVPIVTTYQHSRYVNGYGYQFWRCYDNSFCFNGMGCQYAICIPDKEMIVLYNGDNQSDEFAKKGIFDAIFDLIVRKAQDAPLPENPDAQKRLADYSEALELHTLRSAKCSPMAERIEGKTFCLEPNKMEIEWVRFTFSAEGGTLFYKNAQGENALPFGFGKNVFGKFPQKGYADRIGTVAGDRLYDCAVSAGWADDSTLELEVQIIDTYFGRLHMVFAWREDLALGIYMKKSAEDFLNEYNGFATGEPTED